MLIIGFGLLLQACPTSEIGCEGIDENRYSISQPSGIHVYPEQTTFQIGDTIWIESTISSSQITNKGQEVNIYDELGVNELEYQGFLFAVRDNQMDTNPRSFAPSLIVNQGNATVDFGNNGDSFHNLFYQFYDESNYKLNVGYILEEVGLFSLYDPDLDRMRVIAKKGNGCGEKYTIYTSLANPNNGFAYEFEVIE